MTVTKKTLAGATLATTAAMLFAFAPVSSVHAETEVMCMGINACKGQGACKTADNACAGQNACKGHGLTKTTAADCDAKGGSVAQ